MTVVLGVAMAAVWSENAALQRRVERMDRSHQAYILRRSDKDEKFSNILEGTKVRVENLSTGLAESKSRVGVVEGLQQELSGWVSQKMGEVDVKLSEIRNQK